MKNMKYAFVALLLSVPAISQAGIFVEPGITYQSDDTTIDYGGSTNKSSGKNTGLGISARFGFDASDIIFIGLDGRYAITKFEDSAFNTNVSAKSYNLGPVVGIQMPIVGLRVWGGYILSGELDPDEVTTSTIKYDGKLAGAKGYRVGVGFHFILVSINLEYQDIKYNDNSATTSVGIPVTLNEATEKGLVLGVSFPIGL